MKKILRTLGAVPRTLRGVLWTDLFRTGRRARRDEFWRGLLCLLVFPFPVLLLAILLSTVIAIPVVLLAGDAEPAVGAWELPPLIVLFGGIAWGFIASVTLVVRRLHDLGLPGWWYAALPVGSAAAGGAVSFLLGLGADPRHPLPVDIFAVAFYFLGLAAVGARPSSPTDNRWGPAPAA